MTVINNIKTLDFISNWIGNYSKKCGIKQLIIPYENTYASFLTVYLCLDARRVANAPVQVVRKEDDISVPFIDVQNHIVGNVHSKCLELSEKEGIIVSPISATRSELIRDYHKYNDAADIYPILTLLDSDIEELSKTLNNCPNCPSFDSETEWAMRENVLSGIISSDNPPQQNKYWFRYTIEQKRIVSKLHTRYHMTQHKSLKHKMYPLIPDSMVVDSHIIGGKDI